MMLPPLLLFSKTTNSFASALFVMHYVYFLGPNHEKTVQENKSITVPTQINHRWFIRIWGFKGGGLLKFLPIKSSKSLKKWTFGAKKWWFIQAELNWVDRLFTFQGGGLLKFLPIKDSKSLQKGTFGPKKCRFILILLYWWFNQEWRFICVDTEFKSLRGVLAFTLASSFNSLKRD